MTDDEEKDETVMADEKLTERDAKVANMTKRDVILTKFKNFVNFLRENSDEHAKIDVIEKLTCEEMLSGYVKNVSKFNDAATSAVEVVIFLNITPLPEVLTKIERYITFFKTILEM